MIGHDGVAEHESTTGFSAAANLEILPAPAPGYQIVVFKVQLTGTALVTLQFQNAGGTSLWQASMNANTNSQDADPYGLFSVGVAAALHINNVGAVLYRYNVTYEVRPMAS